MENVKILQFNEQISTKDNQGSETPIQTEAVSDRKKALLLRLGGVGDILTLTPVAKQLHKKGFDVHFYCGSPTGKVHELLTDLPYIKQTRQLGAIMGVQCIQDDKKNYISKDILRRDFDEVFDMMYFVEGNRPALVQGGEWRESINSNYINWIDLSMGWCKIDPEFVAAEDKRPELGINKLVYDRHFEWLKSKKLFPLEPKALRTFPVIGVQLQASTLIRTWYRAGDLPETIHREYPNAVVLIFGDNKWFAISKHGRHEIKFDEDINPLIISTILIEYMNCFIAADSGMSHIAEAVGTKNITIYTTVPSWTRMKYYKHSIPIDANVECFPCFTLDMFCPINKRTAKEALTDRERFILESAEAGKTPMDLARELESVPGAVNEEFMSAKKRLELLAAREPACVKSISSDMIMNALRGAMISL